MADYIKRLETWSKEVGIDEQVEYFAQICIVMGQLLLVPLVFPFLLVIKLFRLGSAKK